MKVHNVFQDDDIQNEIMPVKDSEETIVGLDEGRTTGTKSFSIFLSATLSTYIC